MKKIRFKCTVCGNLSVGSRPRDGVVYPRTHKKDDEAFCPGSFEKAEMVEVDATPPSKKAKPAVELLPLKAGLTGAALSLTHGCHEGAARAFCGVTIHTIGETIQPGAVDCPRCHSTAKFKQYPTPEKPCLE